MVCRFLQHDLYRLAGSICRKTLVDAGGRALTLGPFFFLMKSVKRANSFYVPGGCQCSAMKTVFASPSDPPSSRSFPPVHYPGKTSLSRVFSAMAFALVRTDMRSYRNWRRRACHATADAVAQHCRMTRWPSLIYANYHQSCSKWRFGQSSGICCRT